MALMDECYPLLGARRGNLGSRSMLLLGSFGAPVGAVVFDVPNVESAILVVADTGQVLFEKNADTPFRRRAWSK